VSKNGEGRGDGREGHRSRQRETSARIHLLDWTVTGAARSTPTMGF